ncbi:addiction module toxin RelE, partial [Escherichia coli]|nr:addiction module toxin RelE [Escherichia coli]
MLSDITDSKVYLVLHFGVQCTCQGGVMGKAIIFIETPMFTRQIKQIATDDELK